MNSITSEDYPDNEFGADAYGHNGPKKHNGSDSNKKRECTTYKYSAKSAARGHCVIRTSSVS